MNHETLSRFLPMVLASSALVACSPASVSPPGDEVRSTHPRITTDSTVSPAIRQLTHDNTAFGTDMYRQIAEPGRNLIFSKSDRSHVDL